MAVEIGTQVEAVWRMESARIVAGLLRITGDLGMAEDAAQEAVSEAIAAWPRDGVPDNPGAWLSSVARRRAIDRIRRQRTERRVLEVAGGSAQPAIDDAGLDARMDGAPEDDVLRVIFMACHPALTEDVRAALCLKVVCGLAVPEIARAYLAEEATIAQRLVRAKRTLAEHRAEFDVPTGKQLSERLASVLDVIYLMFNEGYTATSGAAWMRPTLCEEALRLVRMLAAHMPDAAHGLGGEVHGLGALMELQGSRLGARIDASGKPILLMDQDRSRWDRVLIRRGMASLERARQLGLGSFGLQAEIAACHARATEAVNTDWNEISKWYTKLYGLTGSAVVALNLAVAVGMAEGPEAGLRHVDALASHPALQGYHLLPSVRGEFLQRLGRMDEAKAAFAHAASLARNDVERDLLLKRAGASAGGGSLEETVSPSS